MLLYALAVLLSSFLLFLVQPIIAKQIVPWFGGSASVWSACLTFFQLVLLAGYAYSDLVQRLQPRVQTGLHAALLVVSLISLPILAADSWKPMGDEAPLLRILGLLAVTIGLPYFMLSTTGPLIQSWWAREQHDPQLAQRAYRLFALSNAGSLLGLVSYPFIIEPYVSTQHQAWVWSTAYAVFTLLVILVGLRAMRRPMALTPSEGVQTGTEESTHRISLQDHLFWFCMAGLATLLLLAISSHITQNVASIPFLWILPLSLYLMTFVLAFEGRGGRGWYRRETFLLPALAVSAIMAWGLVADDGIMRIQEAIPLYLGGLFLVCFFCHGELAQSKPPARKLTRFYFMVALGGACGGLTVSLLAPQLAPFYWELPAGLLAVALMALWVVLRQADSLFPTRVLFVAGAVASMTATVYYAHEHIDSLFHNNEVASRNFYGTLRVNEARYEGQDHATRRLVHGVILHGLQSADPALRRMATTYYGPESGAGLAIDWYAKNRPSGSRVGVVGLGVGTLAVYGRAQDHYRFYEINDAVIDLAQDRFTYLSDSPAEKSFSLGDARLQLEREPPQAFDVLVIDAFSSDAIPVHLITQEAMEVYLRHLKPDGAIVFHVTNRYLRLPPVVQQLAHDAGLMAMLLSHQPDDTSGRLLASTDYVLVTRNKALMADPDIQDAEYIIEPITGLRLWTDDFNNLLQVLK
ncbi:MAG: spermidine synthase [Burkholderiaceae bacterium]